MDRNYSKLDRFITSIDDALRITTGDAPVPFRENPAGDLAAADLDEDDRRHVAGLMRINHTGEICAQALYAGQHRIFIGGEVNHAIGYHHIEAALFQ